jgi:hypothetical protein
VALTAQFPGHQRKDEYDSRKYDEARQRKPAPVEVELTLEERQELEILRYCSQLFNRAQRERKPFETFDRAWALFSGEMWNERRPNWRASITINKIRAFILFMQAIMNDTKPRYAVEPEVEGTEDTAELLRKLVDREWDDNDLQSAIAVWTLYGLIWGYSFIKRVYDPFANNGRGKLIATVIPPYRIYTNKTATCVEDAEYIIHVEDMTMSWIRENFPNEAEIVSRLRGVQREDNSDQIRNRDFIHEGSATGGRILSAMQINGNIVSPQSPMSHPNYQDDDHETVEVAEYWLKDQTRVEYQRQKVENDQGVFEPVIENGEVRMEVVGTRQVPNEIDGTMITVPKYAPKMKPVMESAWRYKFPNGRLVTIAGGQVLLRDIPNPYQTTGFPFAMWKDQDIGSIYGQGEPLQLQSMAIAVNKIASQVFEILEKTGNPSWKVKKGGVNLATIKNKPGYVIPMENVADVQPLDKPPIPPEFFKLFEVISAGMGEVSGVNPAVTGAMKADNASYAAVDQLQESGAAPIRQKVRNFESGLTRLGRLTIELLQQFDQGNKPLRVSSEDPGIVRPANEVAVSFRRYKNEDLRGQVEFKIVPISSLSTSPSGVWNRWMTLVDKHLIDQTWWHKKFKLEGWRTELPRMLKQQEQDAKLQAMAKQSGKPGPAPSSPARQAHRKRQPPSSNLPSRRDNAMVR